MQSPLEQYIEEITRPLPLAEREEWRTEVEQHLDALIAAYEELGHSREEAVQLAAARFGAPERLGRQMRRETWLTRIARNRYWRRFAGVARLSLLWTLILQAAGLFLATGSELLTPGRVGLEGAVEFIGRMGLFGCVAGLLFGFLLLIVEGRRGIEEPRLFQWVFLGTLAGFGARCLLFDQMYALGGCLLGLIAAVGSIAVLSLVSRKRRAVA
jgi:hypothetical protein